MTSTKIRAFFGTVFAIVLIILLAAFAGKITGAFRVPVVSDWIGG
jgi:hypothetical protein